MLTSWPKSKYAPRLIRRLNEFGQLDILVNNAGVGGPRRPLTEEPVEDWERMIQVNLRGVFFGMKYGLPPMLERGYGRIINTASQLAHKPSPFNASYCASKAGVVALTVSAAQEVATQGDHGQRRLPRPDGHPHVAHTRKRAMEPSGR